MFTPDQRTVLGSELSPAVQRRALDVFIFRHTGDHKPYWATLKRPDGSAYPVQFATDTDWLNNTLFAVTKTGQLTAGHDCQSSPTWPNNPELRRNAA